MHTLSKQTNWTLNPSHREQINPYKFSLFITDTLGTRYMYVPFLVSSCTNIDTLIIIHYDSEIHKALTFGCNFSCKLIAPNCQWRLQSDVIIVTSPIQTPV